MLEAYQLFASQIDDRWYFTDDNFQKLGKSIGDALAELGFPKAWLEAGKEIPLIDQWKILRKTQTVGCQIDELFQNIWDNIFPARTKTVDFPAL